MRMDLSVYLCLAGKYIEYGFICVSVFSWMSIMRMDLSVYLCLAGKV